MGSITEMQGLSRQEEDDIVQTSTPASTLPPPPPPPPPPLPFQLPGLGDPVAAAAGGLSKRKMRRFFWRTIPEEKVRGRANLWTPSTVMSQDHIDVQKIEELFGQNTCQSNVNAMPLRGRRIRGSFKETKEMVFILNLKRAMNIEIFLKQFKRSSETIVDDIRHGNSDTYGVELLRELLKLLPDTEEVKKLKSYQGNVSSLSLADSFMYLLIQLPCYSVRVESMLFKEEFPGVCEAIKRDIRIIHSATRQLMCCEELHTVLHLLLQAGNIINYGAHSGNAVGFKLSSLPSLSDIKANRDGMNLLHFVAMEAQRKDEQLLQFPLKLTHIQAAARISIETLDTELQYLMSRTLSVEEGTRRDAELEQQLDDFLQGAASFLSLLRVSRQQLQEDVSKLIDFFCEDRDTFRLDECFSVFYTFCCKFTAAVKENMEWEVKEAVRRRNLQELQERKWNLCVGNKKVRTGFRLCSSSKADSVLRFHRAGLLVDPKSHAPLPPSNTLSPVEHLGSLCRLWNSYSSPSIAAEHGLEGEIPDSKEIGGGVSAKPEPEVPTCSIQQTQQPFEGDIQTQLSPPQDTNVCHTAATYLSCDAPHNPTGGDSPTQKHSSAWKQEPDHYSGDRHSDKPVRNDQNETFECNASNNMSVCLLKTHKVSMVTSPTEMHHNSCLHQHHQDNVITDLEKEGDARSSNQTSQMGNSEERGRSLSSTQKQEEEEQDEQVVVWCASGTVCANDAQVQTEKDHYLSKDQEGNQQVSSAPVIHMPSWPQPASDKPVPPIIIQTVPVSCCDPSSFQPAAKEVPAHTTGDTKGGKETANHGRRAETVIVETLPQQSTDDNSYSCHTTNDNKEAASSNVKTEQITFSKSSGNNATTSITQTVAMKPKATPCCMSNLSKPEKQGMRISRQGALGKCPKEKLSHQQSSSSTAALNRGPLRQGERPSTTSLSRRSSVRKTQESDHDQELQRKLTVNNSSIKPRPQGGVSVRTPSTPRRNTTLSPHSDFARSTNTTFVRPAPPHSINTVSDSGHKSSFKTVTSFTKYQSISVPPRSPLHESTLTPSKAHKKNDSFSKKSTQPCDPVKTERQSRKQLVSGRRREVDIRGPP